MTRETFDEGVDASIAAVENLMDRCTGDAKAVADREDAALRHTAHKVAYYDALTALEEIRRGDDGCKLRFTGTRAERLQMYLLDQAERYLIEGGNTSMFADVDGSTPRQALIRFVLWLKGQVEVGAKSRTLQLEK